MNECFGLWYETYDWHMIIFTFLCTLVDCMLFVACRHFCWCDVNWLLSIHWTRVSRKTCRFFYLYTVKVTIRPEFFGTVPNFKGLSRKNTRSFGTLNYPEFRTLSRICPDLTSSCVKHQTSSSWSKCSWSFWRFCLSEMPSMSSKCIKCIFGRGGAPDPSGGSYNAPPDAPSPYLSPSAFRSTSWKVSGISIIDLWSP